MDIGEFTLGQQLPGGRFGARWRATGADGREVVLKELARLGPGEIDEFLAGRPVLPRQDNLAGDLAPVLDGAGKLWLVEEWVEGASLAAVTEEQTLSTGQALGVARGLLSGLAAIHAAGQAHGLVSPSTVMLSLDGTPKLVDTGAWLADPQIAAADDFAAPEVASGALPGAAADVHSAGRVIGELLASGPVEPGVAGVLTRATSELPGERQRDAGELLQELGGAAERAYGPLWWTLEGVGGAVATTIGVAGSGTAASGAAAAAEAGMGNVTASLTGGNAAIVSGARTGGGGAGVIRATARTGSRAKVLVPVIVGVVVIAVGGGIALAAGGGGQDRAGEAVNAGPSASATQTAPSTPTTTPTPTPTPTPPVAAGFNGTYAYSSVRTKSNLARFPVGQKQTTVWQVSTSCIGEVCETAVTIDGQPAPMAADGDGFISDHRYNGECVNLDTMVPDGTTTKYHTVRRLKVDKVVDGKVVRLVGTSKSTQLDKCENQREARGKFTYKVTMTLQD